MVELLSIVYMVLFALSGLCISGFLFYDERLLRRIWLGLAFGLCMLMWLPALISFIVGFTMLAQLLALVVCCAVGVLFWLLGHKRERLHSHLKEELPVLCLIVPLLIFCCILLSTHTILPHADGSIWVGQSTYGDLCMHLGFISSIKTQVAFPPMYSICPDKLVGYPFLSSSIGATFYLFGTSLRFATILTAIYAFLLVLLGVYFFFESWLKTKSKAIFSTLLFFIGGGFGFWYFFDLTKANPNNFTRAFSAFYQTPTNFIENGLRWVNPIADMLIPQRALLFGWALLFPCLFLLYQATMEKKTRLFVPLGILAGALPLVHTHSFLALGIASGFYFIRSLLKQEGRQQLIGYLKYLGIVLLLAAPQLLIFTFPQSNSSIKLHWNWANNADNYIWFYIKNFGLLSILLPVALIDAKKEDRAFFGGAVLIWAIAECIQFQTNEYDNNKLLFIWYAYTCGLVGNWLCNVRERLLSRQVIRRASTHVLTVFCCILLFISGIMTLGREVVSKYQLMGSDEVCAADYIKDHTKKDATFLTCNNHNNLVAALTGRNIVCGSGSYLHYHGIDYSARENALPLMYEDPALYFNTLADRYDVDYVLIGPYERGNYAVDTTFFMKNYPVFYENSSLTIYDVSQVPSETDKPASAAEMRG
ncbi:MAG: hypothetical protein RR224_03945 [Clostridia bacterium]